MIEKHYGKYIRNDVDEQLTRLLGGKSETLSETLPEREKVARASRENLAAVRL